MAKKKVNKAISKVAKKIVDKKPKPKVDPDVAIKNMEIGLSNLKVKGYDIRDTMDGLRMEQERFAQSYNQVTQQIVEASRELKKALSIRDAKKKKSNPTEV